MNERNIEKEINLDPGLHRQFRNWTLFLGIGMIVLGIVIVSLSVLTTYVSVMLIGIVLAIRGLIDTLHALMAYQEKGFWWRLFSGILSLVIGVLLFSEPIISAATITLMIAVFLVCSGLFRAIAAPMEHENNWGSIMFGGIIAFILGLVILSGWPTVSLWFIGTLVGVEILLQGIIMVALPYSIRRTIKPSGEAYSH